MGEELDFDTLYILYYERLYRISYAITRDRHHAEDMVQETFLKALKRSESLLEPEKIGAWLAIIARRTAIDFIRREKKRTGLPMEQTMLEFLEKESGQNVEMEVEAGLLKEHIVEAMDGLVGEYKELLVLKLEQGLKEKEIASVLNMNASTVKTRIYRARKKLKDLVDKGMSA